MDFSVVGVQIWLVCTHSRSFLHADLGKDKVILHTFSLWSWFLQHGSHVEVPWAILFMMSSLVWLWGHKGHSHRDLGDQNHGFPASVGKQVGSRVWSMRKLILCEREWNHLVTPPEHGLLVTSFFFSLFFFIRRGVDTETEKSRPCDDRGRDWSNAGPSHGMPRIPPPEARNSHGRALP